MKPNFKQIAIIYFTLLIIHMVAVDFFPEIEPFTKPLLMLTLGFWLFTQRNRFTKKGVFTSTALALIFSLIGDEFMVFEVGNPKIFLMGLVSFLIAHIFYIRAFSLQRNKEEKILNPMFYSLMIQAVFVIMIFNKHLENELKIPVYIYTLVILTMVNYAYLRRGIVDKWNWNIGIVGAFCFVLSDLLLAYSSFVSPLEFSTFWVLSFYGAAQYLIVKSIIFSFEAPKD